MVERNKSAAMLSARNESDSVGRDTFLSAIEASLEPLTWVVLLWVCAWFFDKGVNGAYLILSVIVFSITFPGEPRLNSSWRQLLVDVWLSWVWAAGLLLLAGLGTGYHKEFSRNAMLVWLLSTPALLLLGHLTLRFVAPFLLALEGPVKKAIVVGMNEQGLALAERLSSSPYLRMEFAGFFDDRTPTRLPKNQHYQLLGKMADLSPYVRANDVQIIYLSLPMASQPRILQVLDELKDTTASIFFVPDMFVTDLIQGRSGTVCGMPVISVCETPFTGASGVIKRISDIVLSLIILFLISPILLVVAVAVKWTSPGPILFKQRRYGLDGKEILVYKFRSMKVVEDGAKIQQATKNDSRITPLGRILRKTSIDELPQFINVLQGRMSIVGPRPHAVAHNELYRKLIKGYMVRHKVKPGITGWAQVNGYRGETETLDKMQGRIDFDLDYLRNWSLRLDLYIIFRTIKLVVNDRQAY
ncbi:undecaprenyl-phosphate glucose phosphotransferase [Curvibacter sp. CHRR-16]|uniref:undecaprenyl-phosphate glucose phosphotransferase n=1 Tax=Curvibacter sp. CHRR-16 TaxID=2835872 RepID=UPI001BD9D30A|nr:undecaprenyl-phosphate glucose phosphotransferase [Curvibacter sp. CHRR-16]MBT0571538.1 undecaprenyl-phosphate glucose phosphotransferase [Curvibacter sp. CHRR-16]